MKMAYANHNYLCRYVILLKSAWLPEKLGSRPQTKVQH